MASGTSIVSAHPPAVVALPDRHRRQVRTDELMALLHGDPEPDAQERADLVNEIIIVNTPVARAIARRFQGRGCALEDLEQAACLALVRAVHQFDPGLGHHFLSYVVPCITGEVKRYFRDIGWMVRPPRPVQELQSQVERERLRIDPGSGRVPSETDIAARLDVPVSAVREALQARGCFTPSSLDSPLAGTDGLRLGDHLVDPATETDFDIAEARAMLGAALTDLSDAETALLRMWFVEERSQRDIGRELGISQSHVSRRIGKVVRRLRDMVDESTPVGAGSAA